VGACPCLFAHNDNVWIIVSVAFSPHRIVYIRFGLLRLMIPASVSLSRGRLCETAERIDFPTGVKTSGNPKTLHIRRGHSPPPRKVQCGFCQITLAICYEHSLDVALSFLPEPIH